LSHHLAQERTVSPQLPLPWTILCDFDGTIAIEDVIDSLLERFGRPGWQQLESDWRKGLIGSRECMRGQVALLDVSREELDEHLAAVGIDRGFAAFVALAQDLRIPLRVVSDGLDYAIEHILGRNGLAHLAVSANRLSAVGDRQWRLDSPHARTGCGAGTCKCAVAEQAAAAPARTLLIGDGASDFCAADRVDFVFAKHRLIEHCRAAGIPYAPIAGFSEAIALLPALLDGRLVAPVLPIPLHLSEGLPA
jgi:2-hydroxy-3-keto-5-methylthiopentenyl-1-phosphate phosphatase